MGKYDSSKYRITPLLELISSSSQHFEKFTNALGIHGLALPYCFYYGKNEKQLKPTKEHLSRLIDYIAAKDFNGFNISNPSRRQLCLGSPEEREKARIEAKRLLEQQYDILLPSSRCWFIFEGFTNPDIYIEGNDYILLGEGKWTEPHITTETANLRTKDGEYRSQMVRHIQAARNATSKKIFAFYIIEADCSYMHDLTPSAFTKQLDLETIQLNKDNKQNIADSFIGYTTWQRMSELFPCIHFPSKAEIDAENK